MAARIEAPLAHARRTRKRYIFGWGGGHADGDASLRHLLGGKGAGLAEMTKAGLPVPAGFTITTEACNDYFHNAEALPEGLWDSVLDALAAVEIEAGKTFGSASNPLLVSVRSGAKFSMPGMMDTVLNLGLNDENLLAGLAALTHERFAWDAYRRFVQMFGRIVLGVDGAQFEHAVAAKKAEHGARDDTELDANALRELVGEFIDRQVHATCLEDREHGRHPVEVALGRHRDHSLAAQPAGQQRPPQPVGVGVELAIGPPPAGVLAATASGGR